MQLHELKPVHKPQKERRVGRGGKRGTYSGRGLKGQKSRAGRKFQPQIREWIKKYPKIRGSRQETNFKSQTFQTEIVNVEMLEKKFNSGEEITPELLAEQKLVRRIDGKVPQVKILGKGDLKKKIIVKNCKTSKQAKEKIEKAGGKII